MDFSDVASTLKEWHQDAVPLSLVKVRWMQRPAAAPLPIGFDENEPSTYPTDADEAGGPVSFRCMVYYVDVSRSVIRQFTEIEEGDILLDIAEDQVRDVLKSPLKDVATGVVFQIGSDPDRWVQKTVGRKLAMAWDSIIGDRRLFLTLLLSSQHGG